MANDPVSSKTLTLPIIHAHWTAALQRPPTTSLGALRQLINSIVRHGVNHGAQHGESTLVSRQHFALIFLDLCLAYAYLGDYWLAITAADSALGLYPKFAIGWFARGLCKAELGQWREAEWDFKQCLKCFKVVGRRLERISYKIDQSGPMSQTGLGEEWVLERAKVKWNYKVALVQRSNGKDPQSPKPERQDEQGPKGIAADEQRLNGIPAGVRMGPGWEAKLEVFDPVYFDVVASAHSKPSPQSSSSKSTENDNGEIYSSWKSDSTLASYEMKPLPLPPIPEAPPTPPPPTVTLPAVRVFSYLPTPNEYKYPQTPIPSNRNSIRAEHLAAETWTPLMPPPLSLESPLKPYFPHGSPEPYKSDNDVWWQGTEQYSGPPPHRRQTSIDDVIAEWIADSDDFDGTLAEGRALGIYPEKYPNDAENESGGEGESEGIIRDDDSDLYNPHYYPDRNQSDPEGNEDETRHGQERQRAITNLPTPPGKRLEKGKEKEIATHLLPPIRNRPEDVNDKGEQILLPKAFEGFPADIERRRVLS